MNSHDWVLPAIYRWDNCKYSRSQNGFFCEIKERIKLKECFNCEEYKKKNRELGNEDSTDRE